MRASILSTLSDDDEVTLTDDNKPNIAWVDSFQQYELLLQLAFEELA